MLLTSLYIHHLNTQTPNGLNVECDLRGLLVVLYDRKV